MLDRRLKDLPAETRRVLALLRHADTPRWPVGTLCELGALADTTFTHDDATGDMGTFGTSLKDNFSAVDKFSQITGGVATVFSRKDDDFVRITTSLKKENGERALQLEISKIAQYEALTVFDIETPPTIAAIGRDNIAEAAARLGFPLILKHNRGGKGLGVRLFLSPAALAEHLGSPQFEEPIDGITLIQRYIKAPEPFITRVEFIGGRFLYAVRVDTSQGFELCPADACQVDAAVSAGVCPAEAPSEKFRIERQFDHALIPRWQAFLATNDIGIAGVEFIVDERGRSFTYDINTNTNYNPDAEAKDGRRGMGVIAAYLGRLLARSREQGALRTGTR